LGVSGDDTGSSTGHSELCNGPTELRNITRRSKLTYTASLLAAGAAATAIAAAPIASAATTDQSCAGGGGGTVCQSPGNVQINDSPGPAQFYPYGGEALLLGGGGFGGGAHGGHR